MPPGPGRIRQVSRRSGLSPLGRGGGSRLATFPWRPRTSNELAASDTLSLTQRFTASLALGHDRSGLGHLAGLARGNGIGEFLAARPSSDLFDHDCSALSIGNNHDWPTTHVEALRLHDAGAHIVETRPKGSVGIPLFFGTVRTTAEDRGQRSAGLPFTTLARHSKGRLTTADHTSPLTAAQDHA